MTSRLAEAAFRSLPSEAAVLDLANRAPLHSRLSTSSALIDRRRNDDVSIILLDLDDFSTSATPTAIRWEVRFWPPSANGCSTSAGRPTP